MLFVANLLVGSVPIPVSDVFHILLGSEGGKASWRFIVWEARLPQAMTALLCVFGQKMTHALRSEMSRKLTLLPVGTLAGQNPGEIAARFSGDVDTVEALFTSGIISMAADACRILSIMAVIAVKNTGLALILLLVLPLFAVFTRHVQKRMLAAQLDNRRAVAAVSVLKLQYKEK